MNDMGKPSPSAIELELESEPQMASDLEPVSGSVPYRSTPVFNEVTLPAAMRHGHRTKACVWAVVRMLEGQAKLCYIDPPSTELLSPQTPGLILPEQPHFVEPIGLMRLQIDFYDQPPTL